MMCLVIIFDVFGGGVTCGVEVVVVVFELYEIILLRYL